jgi:hypothetical protein
MPIDPNIALGYRGIEVPNPLAGMAQVTQIQNALQQQRMGNIQMENALREQGRKKQLETILSQFTPETPINEQAGALQRAGYFQEARALAQEHATFTKSQRESEDARLKALISKLELTGRLFSADAVKDQPTYDAARQRAIQFNLGTDQEIPATYSPELVARIQSQAMSVKDQIAAQQREREVGARVTSAGAAASQAETAAAGLPYTAQRAKAALISANAAAQRANATTTQTRDARVSPLTRLIEERDALPEDSPLRPTYDAAIKRASEGNPPQIQVTIPPGEQAEQKGRGEGLASHEKDVRTAADAARRSAVNIDIAQSALDKGFRTGFGTDAKVAAANVLSSVFGMKDASKYATTGQLFNQTVMEQVLARQTQQKGVQTDQDAARIKAAGIQLGNTVEANQFMLDVARAQNERAIAQDKFYRNWLEDPANKGSLRGAESAWLKAEGNSSIFDTPRLQKYKSVGRAEPASAPASPSPAPAGGAKFLGFE